MENGGKTMEHAMNMYRTVETINWSQVIIQLNMVQTLMAEPVQVLRPDFGRICSQCHQISSLNLGPGTPIACVLRQVWEHPLLLQGPVPSQVLCLRRITSQGWLQNWFQVDLTLGKHSLGGSIGQDGLNMFSACKWSPWSEVSSIFNRICWRITINAAMMLQLQTAQWVGFFAKSNSLQKAQVCWRGCPESL